jgi:3'-5' exoribonuclease
MDTKPIRDYVIDDTVTGFFVVRRKEIRDYSRGRFVALELGDHSGRIKANIWEPDQFALEELAEGMVVKLQGSVGEYRNQMQMTVRRIRQATDDEYEIEQVLAHSPISREERRARILDLTERIENTYVEKLVRSFWDDEEFFDAYLLAPAGKLWHHAYIGGLSEHSGNVTELAIEVGGHYDFVDRDLLIFGGLLHDAGKVATYTRSTMFDYTDEGRLVGHICLADQWICQRAAAIEAFPERLLMELRHIVLAHQGELEFATPVVPQMAEAFIVYFCDEIDSKMGAFARIREKHGGVGWSDWVKMLDRFLYFGREKL